MCLAINSHKVSFFCFSSKVLKALFGGLRHRLAQEFVYFLLEVPWNDDVVVAYGVGEKIRCFFFFF